MAISCELRRGGEKSEAEKHRDSLGRYGAVRYGDSNVPTRLLQGLVHVSSKAHAHQSQKLMK